MGKGSHLASEPKAHATQKQWYDHAAERGRQPRTDRLDFELWRWSSGDQARTFTKGRQRRSKKAAYALVTQDVTSRTCFVPYPRSNSLKFQQHIVSQVAARSLTFPVTVV